MERELEKQHTIGDKMPAVILNVDITPKCAHVNNKLVLAETRLGDRQAIILLTYAEYSLTSSMNLKIHIQAAEMMG